MSSLVQIVDHEGQAIGTMDKLEAHQKGGVLHRAVSVLLMDPQERLLLQRRANGKYHFAGRWANTCCTHPSPSETPLEAAERALKDEMGVETRLEEAGTLTYEATDPATNLTEKEFDHVFVGTYEGQPPFNRAEVQEIAWVEPDDLVGKLKANPDAYAPWLREVLALLMYL